MLKMKTTKIAFKQSVIVCPVWCGFLSDSKDERVGGSTQQWQGYIWGLGLMVKLTKEKKICYWNSSNKSIKCTPQAVNSFSFFILGASGINVYSNGLAHTQTNLMSNKSEL